MNIAVLVKQVPDMENVKFDRERGLVDRASAGTEVNPFDLNALEAAVSICEQTEGHVTAISMGPPAAADALRECIARGANEGLLVSDRKFGGSDTRATSLILSSAIQKAGPFDLIIAGEKTVDGDTGQVGPEIAELLNIPHASCVSRVDDVKDSVLRVVSEVWDDSFLKQIKLPALLCVTKDINEPRLPSFKSKMAARKAEIKTIGFDDLTGFLQEKDIGIKGSPTKVKGIEVPPVVHRSGVRYRDNEVNAGIAALVHTLSERKVL